MTEELVLDEKQKARALLKDGLGVEDIAVKLGRSLGSVRAYVAVLRAKGWFKAAFPGQRKWIS